MENMNVIVEVWPVATDSYGIWLISGADAWRSAPIGADSEPHFEVELLLAGNGILAPKLLHSTSWRPDDSSIVLTYMAVIDTPDPVLEDWATARPIPNDLLERVGRPAAHGAAGVPIPRYIDVLLHGLRHLQFLRGTDAEAMKELTGWWATWLEKMTPALAGMYRKKTESA